MFSRPSEVKPMPSLYRVRCRTLSSQGVSGILQDQCQKSQVMYNWQPPIGPGLFSSGRQSPVKWSAALIFGPQQMHAKAQRVAPVEGWVDKRRLWETILCAESQSLPHSTQRAGWYSSSVEKMCFGSPSKSGTLTPPLGPRPPTIVKTGSHHLPVRKFPLNMAYVNDPNDVQDVLLDIYGSKSAFDLEV